MIEAGYLSPGAGSDDGRRRPLRLTRRGHRRLAAVESIHEELEAEWPDRIGATGLDGMRRDPTCGITAAHGGRLPPVPPSG